MSEQPSGAVEGSPGRSNSGQRILRSLLISLPFILLLVDLWVFPRLITSRTLVPQLSLARLYDASSTNIHLGRLNLHELYASMGTFRDISYLQKLRFETRSAAHVALVATVFADDEPHIVGVPEFLHVLMNNMSPSQLSELVKLLDDHSAAAPGAIYSMALSSSSPGSKMLDVERLYLIHLPMKPVTDIRDALSHGLASVARDVSDRHLSGLILPCLGVAPETTGISIDDFLDVFFRTLTTTQTPPLVSLSLYSDWPEGFQEAAIASFNQHWAAASRDGLLVRIYRFEWRLALLSLALCLFVCSKQIVIAPRSAIVIAVAYISMLLESFKLIDWAATQFQPDGVIVAKVLVAAVVAIGFPHFVRWGVKELFSTGGQQK